MTNNTTTKIETLRRELDQRVAERQAQMQAQLEEAKILCEMRKLESPLYIRRGLEKQDNAMLDAILNKIEENYALDNRKISRVFGYGVMVDKILTIIKSIQYSKADEKAELLAMTGLDESTVEEVLDSLGNTAYFSARTMEIMPAINADVNRLRELLSVVALDMGLVSDLNMNKVNQANVDYQFARAEFKAKEALENTLKYNNETVEYTE